MTKPTVLCVDDELNIIRSLKRMLRKEDYRLLVANSGEEALKLIEQEDIRVVISDYRMPVMTGIELLQQVKVIAPKTIRVILSGYADAGVIVDAINEGEIYRFIAKPWNDQDLLAAIRQCLIQYGLLEENRNLLLRVKKQNKDLLALNLSLEAEVSQGTAFLAMSQQILEELDLPVMGLCDDGLIAVANRAVGRCYPTLKSVASGLHLEEVISSQMASAIQKQMNAGGGEIPAFEIDGQAVRASLRPLPHVGELRGYLLLLDKA